MIKLEDAIFAPVFLPLFGAALSLIAKTIPVKQEAWKVQRWIEYSSFFVGLILPVVALFYLFPCVQNGNYIDVLIGSWSGTVGIQYRFDALSWIVTMLGFSIAVPAWIFSVSKKPNPGFTAIFLVQTAALVATSMTVDLFNLFVCLEVMGIASYVLIVQPEKPGSILASFSYLMVSATAMIFFLLGLYGLYRLTGEVSYEGIARGLSFLDTKEKMVAVISIALITAAIAMRVAVMPLYGWLPDAHALAPHGISAVLSGVLIKTPLFALYRVLTILPLGKDAGALMGYAGACTALVAVVVALSQKDAKRLLAYHSISQIGYIVAVWGEAIRLGPETSQGTLLLVAALLHGLFHALFKGLLFLSVGVTTDVAHERNVYVLRDSVSRLRLSGEKFPVTATSFAVAALSIMAIPPLNGFASKNLVTYALKDSWQYSVLFMASIGTVASFIKLSRIYWPSKHKPESREESLTDEHVSRDPAQLNQLFAQAFLAFGCILTGVFASPLFSLFYSMLSGKEYWYNIYTSGNLYKTALMVFGGVCFFL